LSNIEAVAELDAIHGNIKHVQFFFFFLFLDWLVWKLLSNFKLLRRLSFKCRGRD
jgi:hypothetical protein